MEAFPTWLGMAVGVGAPWESPRAQPALPGAGIRGSSSSCGLNPGLIPEGKVGELWELLPGLSGLSLSQRCRCAPFLYIEMSVWGGDKPPGASGFMEGRGFFHIYLCLPRWGLRWQLLQFCHSFGAGGEGIIASGASWAPLCVQILLRAESIPPGKIMSR